MAAARWQSPDGSDILRAKVLTKDGSRQMAAARWQPPDGSDILRAKVLTKDFECVHTRYEKALIGGILGK